jgi:hypothetical protein
MWGKGVVGGGRGAGRLLTKAREQFSAEKNRIIYGGNTNWNIKKMAGKHFPVGIGKQIGKNRLKKRTGIRNSAEFRTKFDGSENHRRPFNNGRPKSHNQTGTEEYTASPPTYDTQQHTGHHTGRRPSPVKSNSTDSSKQTCDAIEGETTSRHTARPQCFDLFGMCKFDASVHAEMPPQR